MKQRAAGARDLAALTEARIEETQAKAEWRRLQNEKLRGNLVPREELEKAVADAQLKWIESVVRMRARMLAIPARLLSRLPGLTPADKLIIEHEVRSALEELADTFPEPSGGAQAPSPAVPQHLWIETRLRLPKGLSASPGCISLWAYQGSFADSIGDPSVPRVTLIKPSRVGYTLTLCAAVANFIENDPSSIILLLPRLSNLMSGLSDLGWSGIPIVPVDVDAV